MNDELRGQVRQRALDRCEYCQMPQNGTVLPHEVDHIRSLKHGDTSTLENLCWACAWCNSHKGTDIAAHPPGSDDVVPLFNPRTDSWPDHFHWEGAFLRAKTPVATARIEASLSTRSGIGRVGTWSKVFSRYEPVVETLGSFFGKTLVFEMLDNAERGIIAVFGIKPDTNQQHHGAAIVVSSSNMQITGAEINLSGIPHHPPS